MAPGEREDGGGSGPRARSRVGLVALLVLGSTAFSLVALELALRVYKGDLFGPPDPYASVAMIGAGYPATHDPLLGYAPRPGASGRRNPWGALVTIRSDGTRSNGAVVPPLGTPIVVVGDSFTFGDEVDDRDTWPAALERGLRRPVVNGGVFGYGFDQIVLRAELLLAASRADTLVVAVIPDDVARCEYSYRYAWKPYFDVVDGALALRNTPVPDPRRTRPDGGAFGAALRESFLADLVLRRLDPVGWFVRGNLRVHRQGEAVAELLVDRLADAAASGGHRVLLLVLWHPGARVERIAPVVTRARSRGLPVVEMEPLLRERIGDDPRRLLRYFTMVQRPDGSRTTGHLAARGNELVAQAVAAELAGPGS